MFKYICVGIQSGAVERQVYKNQYKSVKLILASFYETNEAYIFLRAANDEFLRKYLILNYLFSIKRYLNNKKQERQLSRIEAKTDVYFQKEGDQSSLQIQQQH